MRYVSTRGNAPELDFSEVLLTGLARDGGLYLPKEFPQLSTEEISGFAGKPYSEVALKVIAPFVGDSIPQDDLKQMIDEAYASFAHKAVTPLVQTAPNTYVLELFHGPTLAFKDVAMQLLGRLMDYVLAQKGTRAPLLAPLPATLAARPLRHSVVVSGPTSSSCSLKDVSLLFSSVR